MAQGRFLVKLGGPATHEWQLWTNHAARWGRTFTRAGLLNLLYSGFPGVSANSFRKCAISA